MAWIIIQWNVILNLTTMGGDKMLNYWWVTRPKRKLNSIPDVLAVFAESAMQKNWQGERGTHLDLELALEKSGLKREGDRRDQTGGGGRTYKAWLASLGLIFVQESTKKLQLTLAGEAILNGESPVKVLTNQILKYQFPSAFSRSVGVSERFKIHPFWFLLKLMSDSRVRYLTQEEIAKIVIIEAENESQKCYEKIVKRLIEFRSYGDSCLESNFAEKYTSSKGTVNLNKPYGHLLDIANTIINWLEYTQLVIRDNGRVSILEMRLNDVKKFVERRQEFISRSGNPEHFQRRYGLVEGQIKDTRNLLRTKTVTDYMIAEMRVKKIFISLALKEPIGGITTSLVYRISEESGIRSSIVSEVLQRNYPHGSIGAFMSSYFEMAFASREQSREFEESTANIFREIFKFKSEWLGSAMSGRAVPDVLLVSDDAGFQAVIDTKAYSRYDLPTTQRDRMIYHYLPEIKNYSSSELPMGFFSYIAGGFSNTIARPLREIVDSTGVSGSAMPVTVFIKMIENNLSRDYTHDEVRQIFSLNRQISIADL